MMQLALDCRTRNRPDLAWLTRQFSKALRRVGKAVGDLNVIIVDDARIAKLHVQYLGVEGSTDVITFDLVDPKEHKAGYIEGEIFVCLDEARRSCARRGIDVEHELLLYMIHGLLHLLGYDDHDPEDYRRMHRREDELLEQIGVGAVFKKKMIKKADRE